VAGPKLFQRRGFSSERRPGEKAGKGFKNGGFARELLYFIR
jgi:hypothetical protein